MAIQNPFAMKSAQAPLRKTVDLDDDVVERLREAVRVEGRSRNAVLNDAIRRTFAADQTPGRELRGAVPTKDDNPKR
jgi:metal-responsive CopG/Arc/MetJ family transcriptional regulator